MIPCARFAYFTLLRDSAFATLAGSMLAVGFSFDPPLALKIAATVALAFAITLVARTYFLTDRRFRRSEAWRALTPEERPAGEHGRRLARAEMKLLLLRFAKGASALAVFLYVSALIVIMTQGDPGFVNLVTAAAAGHTLH